MGVVIWPDMILLGFGFLNTSQIEEKFPTKPCMTKIIFSPVLLIVN